MVLIIGGYAQGKRAYAIEHYHLTEGQIIKTLPEAFALPETKASERKLCAVDDFNDWARECFQRGENAWEKVLQADRLMDGGLILLAREIGNGIVPIDREDRLFREWMGRLQAQIAGAAVEVVRICCGLPMYLKKAPSVQVELMLIRHGATVGNRERRYIGRTDESLSEESCKELKERGSRSDPPAVILSSPLRRCLQTAGLLWPDCDPIVIDDLREMDFGDFEGKNYTDLKDNADYQAWIDSNGTIAFPRGESRAEFIHRSIRGLAVCCRTIAGAARKHSAVRYAEDCRTMIRAAAVVHGGTIMAVLSSLTEGDYFDFQVKNGEGYRLQLSIDPVSGSAELLEYEKI